MLSCYQRLIIVKNADGSQENYSYSLEAKLLNQLASNILYLNYLANRRKTRGTVTVCGCLLNFYLSNFTLLAKKNKQCARRTSFGKNRKINLVNNLPIPDSTQFDKIRGIEK